MLSESLTTIFTFIFLLLMAEIISFLIWNNPLRRLEYKWNQSRAGLYFDLSNNRLVAIPVRRWISVVYGRPPIWLRILVQILALGSYFYLAGK